MRGKGKSGATTAAKENAANTVAKDGRQKSKLHTKVTNFMVFIIN